MERIFTHINNVLGSYQSCYINDTILSSLFVYGQQSSS